MKTFSCFDAVSLNHKWNKTRFASRHEFPSSLTLRMSGNQGISGKPRKDHKKTETISPLKYFL